MYFISSFFDVISRSYAQRALIQKKYLKLNSFNLEDNEKNNVFIVRENIMVLYKTVFIYCIILNWLVLPSPIEICDILSCKNKALKGYIGWHAWFFVVRLFTVFMLLLAHYLLLCDSVCVIANILLVLFWSSSCYSTKASLVHYK